MANGKGDALRSLKRALKQLAWEVESLSGMEASRRILELAATIPEPPRLGRPPVKRR